MATYPTISDVMKAYDYPRLVLELRSMNSYTMVDIEGDKKNVDPAILEREVLAYDSRWVDGVVHIFIFTY